MSSVSRNPKACTQCKQVKLRCDSAQTFPRPCTRCDKRSLQCTHDSSFQRVRRRELPNQLEKVTKELEQLQRSVRQGSSSASQHSPSQDGDTSQAADAPSSIPGSSAIFEEVGDASKVYQLETVQFDAQTCREILQHYRKYYHHHVPILRTDTPASDLHSFLFWTIIITSSRLHPKYTQLHAQLLPSYRALLSETIIENVRDVEAIQAIILLCQWPLPVDRQWKDPSWTFCGLAVNAALQEGLHLPDLSLPSESTYHLHNTWIACFVTNTVLSWVQGLVPFSGSASILESAELFSRFAVPHPDFAVNFRIQRFAAKVTMLIDHQRQEGARLSVARLLNAEIDQIRHESHHHWPYEAEILLMSTKLNLHVSSLVTDSSFGGNSTHQSASDRAKYASVMYDGQAAAISLIHTFNDMTSSRQRSDMASRSPQDAYTWPHPCRHLPKYYFRTLVFATFFLLKWIAINQSSQDSAVDRAWNAVRQSYAIFMDCTFGQWDEPERVAWTIQRLAKLDLSEQPTMKVFKPEKRLGHSPFQDVSETARLTDDVPPVYATPQPSNLAGPAASNDQQMFDAFDLSTMGFGAMDVFMDNSIDWSLMGDILGDG